MSLFYTRDAAKDGFIRVFIPKRDRIVPLSDVDAWKQNGTAIYKDWKIIGDEFRWAIKHATTEE